MKSWIFSFLAAVILCLWCGLPFPAHKTEMLLPVKTVQAALENGQVHLVTEVGEGTGATWDEAVRSLRDDASGAVFFDTAEQLVLCDRALTILPEILESETLRPAAQVYRADALRDPEGLNEYLSAHESGVTVGDLKAEYAGGSLPANSDWSRRDKEAFS